MNKQDIKEKKKFKGFVFDKRLLPMSKNHKYYKTVPSYRPNAIDQVEYREIES